jgi:hypothetical protein
VVVHKEGVVVDRCENSDETEAEDLQDEAGAVGGLLAMVLEVGEFQSSIVDKLGDHGDDEAVHGGEVHHRHPVAGVE